MYRGRRPCERARNTDSRFLPETSGVGLVDLPRPPIRGQILLAERPRGVEQPRKKLGDTKKRAVDTKNSRHAKNTTPGFRSILACDGPQKGCGILNFPDFVPRIQYTWYALVFVIGVLSVLHQDLRDVTFRCSVQYRWR